MKNIAKILFLISVALVMSCEKTYIYNCDACLETEPSETPVTIRLNPTFGPDPYYHVKIFRGNIEDNIVIDERDTHKSFVIYLDLNVEYSATARIVHNDALYTAVASTTPKAISNDEYCEEVCFIVVDDKIDLRLKYY